MRSAISLCSTRRSSDLRHSKENCTYHNDLDLLEYLDRVNMQLSIKKHMSAGAWYDPVTTEEELKITKMIKQKTSRQRPPWNCQWHRNGQNIKHMTIALLMGEIHPTSLFAWTLK